MKRAGPAILIAALLSGCGGVTPPGQAGAGTGAQFSPDPGGLAVVGSDQRIDFGRAPSGVIAVLDRELGRGKALGVAGCPANIVDQRAWSGLILAFTAERFVGWRQGAVQAGTACTGAA